MNKTIIVSCFVASQAIESFFNYLKTDYNQEKNNTHCYKILDDKSKVIITVKFDIKEGEKFDVKNFFRNGVITHKKGNCLYTINGLNKLIDEKFPENIGNVEHKTVKIDWSEYQNKMLTIKNNNLFIMDIVRLF